MTRRPQIPVEQRRHELVAVALRVMARDGAWALTTRTLAKEAGIPHGLVHYVFSSKSELIRAVISHDVERASQAFAPGEVNTCDPGQQLRQAMSAYADSLIAQPDLELAMQELTLMAVRDASLKDAMDVSFEQLVSGLLARLGTQWDAPVEVIAQHVVAAIFGASQAWLLDRDEARLRTVLADVADSTVARLTTTPDTARRAPSTGETGAITQP